MNTAATTKNTCAILLAALAWFAILAQLYLNTGSIANFFSYFTIQCNLLIAVSLSFAFIFPASKPGIFFKKLSVQSAIALYIFIVSLVYNTVLRGLVNLNGWYLFVDTLLHVIVPILYLLFWLFFRTTGRMKWKDGFKWLLFPLLYLIYSLIRGAIVHWYPYPFLNADKQGYPQVLLNILVLLLVFLAGGSLLIYLSTRYQKDQHPENAHADQV